MMLADRVTARAAEAVRGNDPVSLEEFGYLLGQQGSAVKSKSGVTVGTSRALGISAWYSGCRYISETVAGLPFHRYLQVGDERDRRADPEWKKRPDQEQTWYGLTEFTLMSLLNAGNSFAFKLRNAIGQVTGLREIHPDVTTTGIHPVDGTKRFRVGRDERVYTTHEVFHIPGLSWDGRFGMNPIRYAADVLGGVAAADEYSSRYFANGAHMGDYIQVERPLTREQARDYKEEINEFHEGLANAHRLGVLSHGSKYMQVKLDAASTQLLESRTFGIAEVSRLLRIPPHKLYELSRATFSNIEHQSIEAVTDSIQPWCERIEAAINADRDLTPRNRFHEFDLKGRLRGDLKSQSDAYAQAVGGPWRTVNEIRRLDNLPPIVGGDQVAAPLNMAPVGENTDE